MALSLLMETKSRWQRHLCHVEKSSRSFKQNLENSYYRLETSLWHFYRTLFDLIFLVTVLLINVFLIIKMIKRGHVQQLV